MLNSKWFLELTTDREGSLHSLEEVLHCSQTEFQKIEILRLGSFGKCLVLDGKIQSTERDEFIYHESLVHPALVTIDNVRSVLIAGGGEGATIREVLRHRSVEEVILVDLDKKVVEACRNHLPEWHKGVFDDPRVTLVFDDARKYVENHKGTFDLIILDLPEPFEKGPVSLLYTREFYALLNGKLDASGAMVTQATSAAVHNCSAFLIIHKTIEEVFPVVRAYVSNIPSFYSPWGFVYAAKEKDPLLLEMKEIEEKTGRLNGLRFMNAGTFRAMFSLPQFLEEMIAQETKINTDGEPISYY